MRFRGRRLAGLVLVLGPSAALARPTPARDARIHCEAVQGELAGMTVNGRREDVAQGESAEAFVRHVLGRTRGEVRLHGDLDTPYSCIGRVIYALQSNGAAKIAHISEPRREKPHE